VGKIKDEDIKKMDIGKKIKKIYEKKKRKN
jgi:hypothetical protein